MVDCYYELKRYTGGRHSRKWEGNGTPQRLVNKVDDLKKKKMEDAKTDK